MKQCTEECREYMHKQYTTVQNTLKTECYTLVKQVETLTEELNMK